MTTINISVRGKTAICPKRYLFSANKGYRLRFDFDEEWADSTVKTARIIFDGEYYDAVFTGDTVEMPKIPVCESIAVGVFTDKLSTSLAQLGCIASAADFDGDSLSEFTQSQYDRIIEILNEADLRQIDSVTREQNSLVITFGDSSEERVDLFDGVGISETAVNSLGELVVTLTDGRHINCGAVRGEKGEKGDVPEIKIGEVTTAGHGESASAEISGTAQQPVLNLRLPKGEKGNDGELTGTLAASRLLQFGEDSAQLFPNEARAAEALARQFEGYRNIFSMIDYSEDGAQLRENSSPTGKIYIPYCDSANIASFGGFSGNTEITDVVFESSINIDSLNAFSNCTNLKSALLPRSVRQLGGFDATRIQSVVSPETTSLLTGAFLNAESLESVDLPKVKTVAPRAFYGCSKLKKAVFPLASSVASQAFYSCASLISADLPAADTISSEAFSGCLNLQALILRKKAVVRLSGTNWLAQTPIESTGGSGYIYVPSSMVTLYKGDVNWRKYMNKIRAIESYPEITGGAV